MHKATESFLRARSRQGDALSAANAENLLLKGELERANEKIELLFAEIARLRGSAKPSIGIPPSEV